MKAGRSAPKTMLNLVIAAVSFAGVIVLLLPLTARSQEAAPTRGILVLYWYNKDFAGNVSFDQRFQAALKSAPAGTVEYYCEYLETDRFPGEGQALVLRDYLRRKYAHRSIDVVVAGSDVTLNFLLKHRDDLFPNTPIIFGASRSPSANELAAGPGATGLISHHSHGETLDLALSLHPYTEHVFVVSGTLEHDKRHETVAREKLQPYEDRVSITYLTDLTPSELTSQMKSLPERSIVLYVWQQAYNEQGKLLETPDVLSLITASTTAPIYGLAGWQVGQGIVGGYVRSTESAANRIAEIALRVANGERAQDIPIETTPVEPIFDWQELQRWGIDEDLLPPGSIIKYRVLPLWDEYKWYAIVGLSVIVVQLLLITGFAINRTLRKRAEEERMRAQSEVTENRARLASIIGSVMDAIISIDESQRIVLFNNAARNMFGYAEQEVLGEPLDRLIPERFRNSHHQHVRAFGETDVTKRSMGAGGTIYGRRADGEEFPIEASISQVELNGQKFYTVILRDITSRKQAEGALREAQESLTIALEAAQMGTWDLDLTRDFSGRRNLRHDQIFGYDAPQADWGREVARRHIVEEDRETFDAAFAHAMVTGELYFEARVRWPDGSVHWMAACGHFYFDEDGQPTRGAGVNFDITERKAAEQVLRDLSGQLIRAREDECARIARELHDDLNQRVALISLELAQLSQFPPQSVPELRQEVQEVIKQAAELSTVIHQMSHDLHPSKLAHLGLVASLKSLCAELSHSYGLSIEFTHADVPSALPREASLCLYRVVQESLSNVVRHSGAKHAQVKLWSVKQELRVCIADSGKGFDVESPRSNRGLGLISMRERLRLVGGAVTIESRSGEGATVEAKVPLRRKGEGQGSSSANDQRRSSAGG